MASGNRKHNETKPKRLIKAVVAWLIISQLVSVSPTTLFDRMGWSTGGAWLLSALLSFPIAYRYYKHKIEEERLAKTLLVWFVAYFAVYLFLFPFLGSGDALIISGLISPLIAYYYYRTRKEAKKPQVIEETTS